MEKKELKELWVFGGMHDPFGGMHFLGSIDGYSPDDTQVMLDAHEMVKDVYESYAGLHGVRSWEDVREDLMAAEEDEDYEVTEQDVNEAYDEEVSNYCSYWVIEAVPGENPEDDKWLETAPWKQDTTDEEEF